MKGVIGSPELPRPDAASAAEDAVTAEHCVVEHVPDLIIADYKMPYMNGVDFVGALRADPTLPDIPVVFLTGNGERPGGRREDVRLPAPHEAAPRRRAARRGCGPAQALSAQKRYRATR
jgi:CheY-like chemotaxis protein